MMSAGETATLLLNGWGYNWYRAENRLRADDLLIRAKLSELLGLARGHLSGLEAAYRRAHLPLPTRDHPLPDRAAVAHVQSLTRAGEAIGAVETSIRNAAVPEMDRVWQRHRNEARVLQDLVMRDAALVETVAAFHDWVVAATDSDAADAQFPIRVREGLPVITAALAARRDAVNGV
ncbi:hypothetical protein [Acidiphilium sp.]|uniref:hypothetical protein n=1 Tax=Acidiphilium sp. TaxID=527 RepID=UPI003CFCE20B